jgi:hypothetical protein
LAPLAVWKTRLMDKALLEVFSGVKNALVTGFVWTVGLYLVTALLWPWWVNPLATSSEPLKVVVDALGTAGLQDS